MPTKSRTSNRTSVGVTAAGSTRRRVSRVVKQSTEPVTPVPVKEQEVEPVAMSVSRPSASHLSHDGKSSGGACTHCRSIPMSAGAAIALLTSFVVALSVFLIDATNLI